MFANMKPFKNKIPLSRGKLLVNQVNSNKHHRCNESVTSEEELTTESIEETNLMAKKNKQTLEWVNSNDFKLKAANKNIITNELEATVLSNTIKPINTTDTTFKKERFKINPKNATFNVDETCKANETKMNSSELNTKKIENIFPNETQSANTIINSKMTTTSNFCLDDNFESFDQTEFLDALTDSEKVLTANYKKVVAGGKGSRAIVILFPKNVQTYINLLLNIRSNSDIVPKVNPYLFACPGVEKQWIRADVIIRKFANASGIENPEAISSNRLRKQIGTLMQILNLNKEEYAQFSKFMGHTEKTHAEFYEITQDAYQAAKVLKLLTLFDEGKGLEYKGKPLNEINLECINEIESDANTELNERQEEIAEQLPETSQEVVLQTNLDTEENKKMHRKKCNRVRWTQNQKNIVSKHFR
ncbi:hypothetical protein RN001_008891 [Aquatica leii]|uniref:Uncharacterized protein n=1 Tax=Aquatica leii TaxID=1421715 RepID=A0AAN7Q5H2_9COLE|nr:hypothetical protein RN001_008891 [Aquatica leii]